MPLQSYSWPTAVVANQTPGLIADTLAAYDRLTKIIAGWNGRGPVVAASTTASALKDTADYVCDGTADQTEINSALATNRPVLALPGTFSCSSPIAPPATWTSELRGCGWGTVFQGATGLGAYVIAFSTSGGNVTGGKLADFKVDANGTNAGAGSGGIYAKGAVQCVFDHIWVTNPYDAGLWLHEISAGVVGHHNRVTNCLFDASGGAVAGHGQGVRMQANDENWVTGCDFESWGGSGSEPYAIKDWSGINFIDHCNFVGGQEAIRVQDASGTRITQPMFDGVGRSCIHIVGSGCTILGGTFSGGGQASAGTYSHIVLDGSGGHSIVGGTHSTDATAGRLRSFVRELGTSNNTVVTGKVLTVNGSLGTGKVERNAQTGNRYRNIIGYDDELLVRKAADETVTSSTVLQNDDHLVLAVEPGCTYTVEAFVVYEGAQAGDLKLGFSAPSGATLDWTPGGLGTAVTAASGVVKLQAVDLASSEGVGAVGTGAANRTVARVSGILVVSSTGGNLQLQWAQNASDATGTVVKAGSWIRAQRAI